MLEVEFKDSMNTGDIMLSLIGDIPNASLIGDIPNVISELLFPSGKDSLSSTT